MRFAAEAHGQMENEHVRIGQQTEPAWLELQSIRWEPGGRTLLSNLGNGAGLHAVDVGCGDLGWLRVLSEWVGPDGSVTGTDVGDDLIEAARCRSSKKISRMSPWYAMICSILDSPPEALICFTLDSPSLRWIAVNQQLSRISDSCGAVAGLS